MICRNSEYYADPTAGKAIANVMREQEDANGKTTPIPSGA